MKAERIPVAILGAGIAGLSIACEFSEKNKALTIVEKSPFVGGIARSVERAGFVFDLGGHRIYSDKKWIIDKLRYMLDGDLQLIKRRSRIRLGDKFIDYPPKPLAVVSSFGLREGTKILTSYLSSAAKRRIDSHNGESFEEWAVSRFGTKMYGIFFKPYTEKICGLPCSEVSVDWGVKRVGVESLLQAFRKAVFQGNGSSKTYASYFYYPRGGIGTLSNRMADRISQGDNKILLGWEVKEVRWGNNRIESMLITNANKRVELVADQYISTIPINHLITLMRPELPAQIQKAASNLKYRSLICILLIVDKEKITNDHWLYFPDEDVSFTRVHEPRNWSEELVQEGKTSLCVEILCNQGDEIWQTPDEHITDKVIADLSRLELLDSTEVKDSFIERIPYAYPLLELGYRNHIAELSDYLSKMENLHLTGRTGMFKYWGIDDVIEEAVFKANQILC